MNPRAKVPDSYPLRIPDLCADLRLRVHAATDIHVSRQIRERGVWEEYETHLLCHYLASGDHFLDAGANIGYFTVVAAQRVGSSGRVFAFEPEPGNYELLCFNLELNGLQQQVHARQAALGNCAGPVDLHLHPHNLGDHQVFASESGREIVSVPSLCGADYLATRVAALDMVKIDTQGAECQVVLGLYPLLRASGDKLRMIVELTPYSLRAAGSSGSELISLLAELQLPLAIIDHIQHQLVPCSVAELLRWCENVDACPEDQGFMNIFLGQLGKTAA